MSTGNAPPAAGLAPPPGAHRVGTGSPLVLLHGLSGSWRIWAPVIDALSEHHDVLAATLPGHHGGPVVDPAEPVTLAGMADTLEGVLDDAGLARAHLVGNSLGGWLALELARRGRASSVVAFSPAGGWRSVKDLRRVVGLIGTAARRGSASRTLVGPLMRPSALRRLVLRETMERGDRLPTAALNEMLDDLAGCAVLAGFMEATERDGPFLGDMSHLTLPIRIAWGERDRLIPFDRYGAPLIERVPGAELVLLPGVGHVPMYDDPALVARTVLEVSAA